MQIKRVKCPNCNTILEVKNSHEEAVKRIKCLRCTALLEVNFPPQQVPLVAHTVLVPMRTNLSPEGATYFSDSFSGSTELGSAQPAICQSLKLTYNGIDYPLAEGQNIIGRQASTSVASIQLPTSDRYMSRQHCCIQVSMLTDGSKKAVLTNYINKNATLIRGMAILDGDQIRLQDGDQITLGRTTITFKIS